MAGKVVWKSDLEVSEEEGFPSLMWCGWTKAQRLQGTLVAMVTGVRSLCAEGSLLLRCSGQLLA